MRGVKLTSEQLELLDKVERSWLDPEPVDPPLRESYIPTIRRLLKAGKSLKFVAGKFCVSVAAISNINTGRTWGHVADRSV